MSQSRLEWKVGLFVAIGLVLLTILLIQFSKGVSFFEKSYSIRLRAPNVGGLKTRAQVLMAGVQVGSVSDIKLAPSGTNVTITLSIYRDYEIHKDALFLIQQSGFLGDQYVAIMPTRNIGPIFRDQDTAETEAPFDLQEVARSAGGFLRRIDETAKKLNDAIVDVRRLVLNEQTLTNLAVAVDNMRSVSERALGAVDKIDTVVSTNSPSIAQSASNLVFFSVQLNQFASELSSVLASNRPGVNAAVENIETSTDTLRNLVDDVQAGKGAVGRLFKDEQMAANLSAIAQNLSLTTSNLNRLGLWGILWRHKEPRTNSPTRPLLTPKNSF